MGRQRPGSPTLEEVAALAGVGRGTVSRVINNAAGVKDSTRRTVERLERVNLSCRKRNLAARSLAGRRADAVTLVMTERDWRMFGEPFFAEIVQSVGDALADASVQLLLTLVRTGAERRRLKKSNSFMPLSVRKAGQRTLSCRSERSFPRPRR